MTTCVIIIRTKKMCKYCLTEEESRLHELSNKIKCVVEQSEDGMVMKLQVLTQFLDIAKGLGDLQLLRNDLDDLDNK